MNTIVLKKQNHRSELPAFSNREIYELLYKKKPRRKTKGLRRKLSRLLHHDKYQTRINRWTIAGVLSVTLIALLLLSSTRSEVQINWLPLQLAAGFSLYLYAMIKQPSETLFYKVSGIFAIVFAAALPAVVMNLTSSWLAAAAYFPAQLALCGIAALYRSDDTLEPAYIFQKALSYCVITLTTGWLSFYCLTNI